MCNNYKALALGLLASCFSATGLAQDGSSAGTSNSVQIMFLPPPLENATYSVGIYEVKGHRLIRRLHEFAPEGAFAAGLNGLITRWDRKDDAGKIVPAGRYAARGYAVGALKVEGVAFHGNDWVDADETLRVKHVESIHLLPDGKGVLATVTMADGAFSDLTLSPDGDLRDRQPVASAAPVVSPAPGKAGSTWSAEGEEGLIQHAADGAILRRLAPAADDPAPRAVVASATEDRLYLLEEKEGWQRLRGLSWVDAREENGKSVSTWQTVFERNIRHAEAPGGADGARSVELTLVDNPLSPGKAAHINLAAGFDAEGSYLQTADGLRLRRISDRRRLEAARLARGKGLTFYQFDGAAWDEFSITGAGSMMMFDAGEFDLTATGEKAPDPKTAEPPDL